MVRHRKRSAQALVLLEALLARPAGWHYGYDLTKQLGLHSGTLYPLLMRLTDEGVLDAEWHAPSRPGLPARHAYRLSAAGIAIARNALDEAVAASGGPDLSPA